MLKLLEETPVIFKNELYKLHFKCTNSILNKDKEYTYPTNEGKNYEITHFKSYKTV